MDDAGHRGKLIDGRYVVEDVIGKGGMGLVFRARHRFTGQAVALKMLHAQMRLRGDIADRFLAEARAPAVIGHPGIVSVTDAGTTTEGELYLVMELLQGFPLREYVSRQPLSLGAVRRIGIDALAALAAAHTAGFVHRDLKPENIFVTSTGTVKLLDFGIAKVLAEDFANKGQTVAGTILGTIWYMSPEQLTDSAAVDLRADLWALGVIVYELLTRARPFRGSSFIEMASSVMTQPPDPIQGHLPWAPRELVAFVGRALARDPRQRFQTAAEMASALAAVPAGPDLPLWQLLSLPPPPSSTTSAPGITPPPPPPPAGTSAPAFAPPPLPPPLPAAPPPVPHAIPHTVAVSPRPPSSRGALILALLAAIAAGVVIALAIAGGGGGRDTPSARVDPPRIVQPPSVLEEFKRPAIQDPPPPLPPLPVDETTPPAPEPTPTPTPTDEPGRRTRPEPPPARTDAQACADGCRTLARCGAYTDDTCQSSCLSHAPTVACAHKVKDCNSASMCVLAAACGGTGPRGRSSCAQAAACEAQCGTDGACACRCVQNMSTRHAHALLVLNQCAISCGGNFECLQARCARQIQRCQAQ